MIEPKKYQHIPGWNQIEIVYKSVLSSLLSTDKPLHIVEIGCWQGRSSMYLLEFIKLNDKDNQVVNIDFIDVWKKFDNGEEPDFIKDHQGQIVDKFVNNLRAAELLLPQVNIIQQSTFKAIKLYEDNSLDFVYIDNDHSYDHVKKELNLWFNKVKQGGFFGGDDYVGTHWGVKKAVDEFVQEKGLSLSIFEKSWLIIKP